MASDLDLCNLALARLGDAATLSALSPPEGSVQGEHCARCYPLARDALLIRQPWDFATTTTALSLLSQDSGHYRYALPHDCLRPLNLLTADSARARSAFHVEDGVLHCQSPNAQMRYVFRQTDAQRFSALFSDALAWLLASHLAGCLLKGEAGAQHAARCLQTCERVLDEAIVADAKGSQVRLTTPLPPWLGARH